MGIIKCSFNYLICLCYRGDFMSMTIGSIASNYYSMYTVMSNLKNTTYDEQKQEVLEGKYGISDLNNVLDSLSSSDNTSFQSVENIFNYSKSLYQLSQLELYSTLSEEDDSIDFSSITSATSAAQSALKSEDIEELYTTVSEKISKYKDYLSNNNSSILDLFV